jgi:hypothetical protein
MVGLSETGLLSDSNPFKLRRNFKEDMVNQRVKQLHAITRSSHVALFIRFDSCQVKVFSVAPLVEIFSLWFRGRINQPYRRRMPLNQSLLRMWISLRPVIGLWACHVLEFLYENRSIPSFPLIPPQLWLIPILNRVNWFS